MKVMGTQVAAMAQLFTPLVNSSVGQATPVATTTPNTNGPVVETVEVIEIDPPEKSGKKVDYLSLLQHLSRLGTKHFSGSTDPIVADEWRSSYKEDKGRAVETQASRPRVGRPQHQGCMSCPGTTALLDLKYSEKNVERKKERKREFRPRERPINGRSRQGEEHGEPRRGSQVVCLFSTHRTSMGVRQHTQDVCQHTQDVRG
ncbi:unnamed protein product [Brassica rapa subsp. narinosa]